MPNTRSARLARWQVLLLIISGTLLWLSGAAWLLLHYYGQVTGEFGPETNPLEPWFLRVHGLVLWDAEMPQLETREEMLGATRQTETFQPELATAR